MNSNRNTKILSKFYLLKTSLILASSLIATYATPLHAANFSVECVLKTERETTGCAILLNGEIASGDADKMLKASKNVTKRGQTIETLVLNSNGGDIAEARKIAKLVKALMLETSTNYYPNQEQFDRGVKYSYPCVSACFLVWASGARRTTKTEYLNTIGHVGIGLHRPYFTRTSYKTPPGKIADAQIEIISVIRTELQDENIPLGIIEKMLNRSSREIYWLSEIDENSIQKTSPWLEEILISQCQFDPEYAREMEKKNIDTYLNQLFNRDDGKADPTLRHWEEWNRGQKMCESRIRHRAQSIF